MIRLSVDSLMLVTMAGACALALWGFVRFPGAAPESLTRGIIHLFVSLAVGRVTLQLIPAAVAVPGTGLYLALLFFILAPMTYMFVSVMWLLRLATGASLRGGLR